MTIRQIELELKIIEIEEETEVFLNTLYAFSFIAFNALAILFVSKV